MICSPAELPSTQMLVQMVHATSAGALYVARELGAGQQLISVAN